MTLAELKQYVADKRKRQASEWANQIAIHGQCTGFNNRDYSRNSEIIFTGKKSYRTKFVHSKLWNTTR